LWALRRESSQPDKQEGGRLPREVLAPFVGLRNDIQSSATGDKGRWTLELKRARATEDRENDVQFTDPGLPYYFGLSVHDSGGMRSARTRGGTH